MECCVLDNEFIVIGNDSVLEDYSCLFGAKKKETIDISGLDPIYTQFLNEKECNSDIIKLITELKKFNGILKETENFKQSLDFLEDSFNFNGQYYFIYNNYKKTAQIVDKKRYSELDRIIDEYFNFQLLKVYTELDIKENQMNEINLFLKDKYFSYLEIDSKIESIENIFGVCQDQIYTVMSNTLSKHFTLTGNCRDKLKCNLIYTLFEKEVDLDKKILKSSLNEILTQNNVLKKRFSDGFFFIGIKQNTVDIHSFELQRQKDIDSLFID